MDIAEEWNKAWHAATAARAMTPLEYITHNIDAMRNARQPTPMEAKVDAARAWLAQREAERGPHRYSSVPTVLLPVAQRRIAREQERRDG